MVRIESQWMLSNTMQIDNVSHEAAMGHVAELLLGGAVAVDVLVDGCLIATSERMDGAKIIWN